MWFSIMKHICLHGGMVMGYYTLFWSQQVCPCIAIVPIYTTCYVLEHGTVKGPFYPTALKRLKLYSCLNLIISSFLGSCNLYFYIL